MADGRLRDYALLGLLALLWGSSYLFMRVAAPVVPPLTLVAVRATGAALLLLAVMLALRVPMPRGRGTWGHLWVQSVLNASGAWVLLAWGIARVDASLATVLNSTSPLWVFVFTLVLTRGRGAGRVHAAGIVAGLSGVVLIVGPAALRGLGDTVSGQIACVLGAMLFGAAALYGRRFGGLHPLAVAAGTITCAAVTLVPLALILERPWTVQITAPIAASLAMLAIPCTGVALLLYFHLLARLGSLGVASQSWLRQGVGVALGIAILGERPGPTVFLGVALAVLGVVLVNRPVRAPLPAPAKA